MSEDFQPVWFIAREGCEYGPLTSRELHLFISHGHLRKSDVVFSASINSLENRKYHTREDAIRALDSENRASSRAVAQDSDALERKKRTWPRRAVLIIAGEVVTYIEKLRLLLRQPSDFFKRYIISGSPHSLKSAIGFFLASFSLSFIILSATSKFYLYTGASEIRSAVTIILQLIVGVCLLYFTLKLLKSRVNVIQLITMVLYFDGIYLSLSSIVNLSLASTHYYANNGLESVFEQDIYGTFFEACVANKSTLYWALRGDLEFFMNDGSTPSMYITYMYLLVAFFCLLAVGRGFCAHYRPGILVFMICTCTIFLVASEGYAYAENKLTDYLANKHNYCWGEAADTIAKRYRTESLAPHLTTNLRRSIDEYSKEQQSFVKFVFPNIVIARDSLVVATFAPSQLFLDGSQRKLITSGQHFAIATYCNDQSYFRLARALGLALDWKLYDETKTERLTLFITPEECIRRNRAVIVD